MALTTSDSFGDTDNSDSTGNGSINNGGSRNNIRLVTLHKSNVMFNGTLGFSIRGGREHTTGVFVSNVEPNSEAERSGLCIGDQIIRINGFPIEDATHAEVLQLIHSQNTISLKVRSVGMIPTKERDKGVTWKFVDTTKSNPNQNERFPVMPITIEVPAHGKLGCGICKGPAWKPGIFVQFTKDACIAKEAGLKRGDQILACNGVKFTPEVTFEHAVSVMKSSAVLELFIHRGVGLDLFPGGSSGYNSSTSSLNGDNQDEPTLLQFKRLSVVKEESVGNGRSSSMEDVIQNRTEPRAFHNSANTISLSSAISEEIKRRSERSGTNGKDFVKVETTKSKTEEDSSYHLKLQTLMKEVKEAHNKMFPCNQEEAKHNDSPPSCPTPDYDTMSVTSNNNNNKVDMASFKSFSAAPVPVKPPPVYFPPPSGFQDEKQKPETSSTSAPPAPVVTLQEYPKPNEPKVPSKFKFLSNNNNNKPTCVRFGDELSQTVSQVLVDTPPSGGKKNTNVVTISIQHPGTQNPFYLHAAKKGPAPPPPTKNKVTFNF
uniref:Harmonin n=1 Tax=Cacopsylla melanoneura TaxID=428564 RepID=A0A8D8QBR9_9HEMI